MREQGPSFSRQVSDAAASLPKAPSGIFISFEERTAAIRQNAPSQGWDLAALEETGRLLLFRGLPALKSRGSKHSHAHHKSLVTDHGINVREIPSEARPSLTGGRVAII